MKRSTSIVTDLQADGNFGLGITVSVLDSGSIVVKSLMRNGPAERDGRLRVGDHINSINDQSLDGATQADVDQLFRQLQGRIRIIASRLCYPDLYPDGLSDCSRDYVLNTGSMSSDGRESSGNRIFRHPSMDSSDLDLDTGQSPDYLTGSQLTTAKANCDGETAGS